MYDINNIISTAICYLGKLLREFSSHEKILSCPKSSFMGIGFFFFFWRVEENQNELFGQLFFFFFFFTYMSWWMFTKLIMEITS